MGLFLDHRGASPMQTELNLRFAPGEALAEMIALQKEFNIFSPQHSLASAVSLLNIAPPEAKDRREWFKFLGNLKRVKSDVAGTSGHDRVVSAIKENLEARSPKPVFFKWHPKSEDSGVHVTVETEFVFSNVQYLTISAPVTLARGAADSVKLMDRLRERVRTYYSGTLKRHGVTPRGVDWQCTATQNLRFVHLLKIGNFNQACSLNDFGCGYGALLAYLTERHPGTGISYHGIDVSPPMIEAACALWRHNTRATFTVGSACGQLADYTLASGVFNVRLGCPIDEWEAYVASILIDLRKHSRRGFSVNFVLPARDRSAESGLYCSPPEPWIAFCASKLGCAVELVSDYGLREFTLLAKIPAYAQVS
jgi:SAM-dependent methyltransferase